MNVVRATQPVSFPEDKYVIQINPGTEAGQLRATVDGEDSIINSFEFVAPVGTGFNVRRVMRVELVPEERFR